MKSFTLPACAGVCFALLSSPAFAQDDDRRTILITASKFAETVDETLSPVTVITRDDIERKQAATVQEVLRATPGLAVANSGGAGKQTSVFLRGTEANHVLVLIDGVKVGNATAGLTPFQDLPLAQVEKIEIVRGPRSSLYGSEAIGGVIQIFTRKGKTPPRFSLAAGSHDTVTGEVSVGGGVGDRWYRVGASAESTGGFNACTGNPANFAGCATVEPDDDSHDNESVSLRGGVALTDALRVEGNFLNSAGDTEFDGAFQNETETVNRTASIKLDWQTQKKWNTSLLFAEHRDESKNFVNCDVQVNPMPSEYGRDSDPPCVTNVSADGATFDRVTGIVDRDEFNTRRRQVSWQNNFRVNKNHRVVAGVDYQNDEVDSTVAFAEDSRDNTGVFALWRSAAGGDDFELSVRNDDNQQFGDHATGSAAWGRGIKGGERVTASYGTAFAAPTFNELYWPGFSNPDLKPEESKSFDVGFSRAHQNGRLTVNLFHTRIKNLIANRETMPVNVETAEISGVELTGFVAAGGWDLHANVTFQNPKNKSGAFDGNALIRRPKFIAGIDINRRHGRHRLGASLLTRGKTFDDAANTRVVPRFTTLDLRGERKLNKNWSLALSVKNVFDEGYEVVAYYPQDRRNFTATLRYSP